MLFCKNNTARTSSRVFSVPGNQSWRLPIILPVIATIFFFYCTGIAASVENDNSDAGEISETNGAAADNEFPRPTREHPSFNARNEERVLMVESQIMARGVTDPNTISAMKTAPRHMFVRRQDSFRAYSDRPLPIGYGQTISQPYIVAYMTAQMDLRPDARVLEIGAGSGYQAAIAAEIARVVYTIEIVPQLARSSERLLRELGYGNVFVKEGDGYYGWPEHGPYDAIIVTAAAGFVPPPLLEQLKPDGKLILPLGSPYGTQTLVVVTRDEDGRTSSRRLMPVRFVPMTGRALEQ